MAEVTASLVKALRDKTGAGMMDCKAALTEMKGDMEQAIDWLRKKGLSKAAKKADRVVADYVHNKAADGLGKIGVLVALESKGDKAALAALGRQIAMHIAAASPAAVTAEELDPTLIERERAVYIEQAKASGKSAEI